MLIIDCHGHYATAPERHQAFREAQRGQNLHVIPGTTAEEHLEEDYRALQTELSADIIKRVESLINQESISGPRYPAPTQAEIDTEEFV